MSIGDDGTIDDCGCCDETFGVDVRLLGRRVGVGTIEGTGKFCWEVS